MNRLRIENATVIAPEGPLEQHTVLCDRGKLARIGPSSALAGEPAESVVDAAGNYLVPGFIDLHIHGTGQFLVDNGPGDLGELCKLLPRYGVTGFLPTIAAPRPRSADKPFITSLARVRSEGAAILGFHFEGPFLALTGAIPPEALGPADPDRVRNMREHAQPYRAIFSVSPEFAGVLELIPIMAQDGAPVFMTHTAATVEQTRAAIGAGVCHATHFYDVFPCPRELDPGVRPSGAVEAVLGDPRVSVDFILDGEHVHPVAVQMALCAKGPGDVCLITDANIGAGLPPGKPYHFGTYDVIFAYAGGPARMTENGPIPGALAGSGLTMDAAVRNAVRLLGVDLAQAARMASANPAKVLRLDQCKGRIAEGYDADLVLLDKDLHVKQCWVGAESRFSQ
jgi:N-acetylglucosamine-6-phosphate deacetylase